MYCKNCGQEMAEGVKFCPSCGESAPGASAGSAGAPAQEPSRITVFDQQFTQAAPVYDSPATQAYAAPVAAPAAARSKKPWPLIIIAAIVGILVVFTFMTGFLGGGSSSSGVSIGSGSSTTSVEDVVVGGWRAAAVEYNGTLYSPTDLGISSYEYFFYNSGSYTGALTSGQGKVEDKGTWWVESSFGKPTVQMQSYVSDDYSGAMQYDSTEVLLYGQQSDGSTIYLSKK